MSGYWVDLGRMAYGPCAALQRSLLEAVAAGRLPHTLLFVEHDPVLSLGAGFQEENLLLPEEEYAKRGIEVAATDRGGDVTYHGPDQLVAYPIFSLDLVDKDLHAWLRALEETVLAALEEFDLAGVRLPPHTGVWVSGRKVCAIGIKVRRWVSMHGLALNVSNDLTPFQLVVPCGIKDREVTSLSNELDRKVSLSDARSAVRRAFEKVFGISLAELSREELLGRLSVGT